VCEEEEIVVQVVEDVEEVLVLVGQNKGLFFLKEVSEFLLECRLLDDLLDIVGEALGIEGGLLAREKDL